MRLIKAATAAVLGMGILAPAAHATLTFSLVPVTISAAAKTADANLNTARSFDLKVTQTGEKWQGSALQLNLCSGGGFNGGLYTPAGHANILSNTPATANLAFDTGITTPAYLASSNAGDVDVLGNSDYKNPVASGATATVSGTTMSIAWGDKQGNTNTTADGTYTVARVTVTGNTGGFLNGYGVGTAGQTATFFNNLYLPILGDTNADHSVDLTDLINVRNSFGLNAGGDTNSDGVTDLSDLINVRNLFGNSITPPPGALPASLGSVVPEPMSMSLVALGGLALVRRRRA